MGRTVNKIGGANMSQLDVVTSLVGEHLLETQDRSALVVSAFKGVTDALLSAMDFVTEQQLTSKKTLDSAFAEVKKLLLEQVEHNPSEVIRSEIKSQVKNALKDVKLLVESVKNGDLRVRPQTLEIRDRVIGSGENISAKILEAHLRAHGLPVHLVSDVSTDLEQPSLHAGIQSGLARSISALSDSVQDKILIFGGHVSGLPNGIVHDIGRSYSDTTAVDLAVALRLENQANGGVVFWKDVDGALTANPKDLSDESGAVPKRLPDMSLYEGLEVARAGSSLLQADALELAHRHRVNLVLKNIADPTAEGTNYGVNTIRTGLPFKTIASHPHDYLELDITEIGGEAGVIEYFGNVFKEAGISVNDVATEGNTMSLTVPLPRDEADKEALRARIRGLQLRLASIDVNGVTRKIDCEWSQDRMANVSLVGSEIQDQQGMLSALGSVLSAYGINTEQVGHTRKQHRISLYLDGRDRRRAVQALHLFFIDKDPETIAKVKEAALSAIDSYA